MNITAIQRGAEFSPNNVNNDALILGAVATGLRDLGHQVSVITEDEFIHNGLVEPSDAIINMCRDSRSIERLFALQEGGAVVVNSPQGIANCNRERLTRLLLDAHVPHPDSLIVSTTDSVTPALEQGGFTTAWIKRGDYQTMNKADITYVHTPQEAQEVLAEFALRGIPRAVISKHLPGDLVKFYGVLGTDFFFHFYPFDSGHSKFGYEEVNGHSTGIRFSEETLHSIATMAAKTLDVRVYGGDAIISPDGLIHLIDFNDWPGFAPCRQQAAQAIVQSITQLL